MGNRTGKRRRSVRHRCRARRLARALVRTVGPIWFSLASVFVLGQVPPVPENTKTDRPPAPSLFFAQRAIDLGRIVAGDKPTVVWILENRGQADLLIEKTRTSCGCTVAQLSEEDKIIPPGGAVELMVEFDSTGRRGQQSKTISVYSNDPAEPIAKLELTAYVDYLYETRPSQLLNLRGVRRGSTSKRTIEFIPGPGGKSVEILDLQVADGTRLELRHEPFEVNGATGQRIILKVSERAALGPLRTSVRARLLIDGIEREHEIPVRGEIIGDLIWRPRELGVTKRASRRGQRLAPVSISSSEDLPFEVLDAQAGPLFDLVVEPASSGPRNTKYTVILTIRSDAPPGPFGAMLEVTTTVLDQPVVRIPVFGIVAAPVQIDPPIVLLRQDSTPQGHTRRLRIKAHPQVELDVLSVSCDNPAIRVAVDGEGGSKGAHIRFIRIELTGTMPVGRHDATLTVATNVVGAETLKIPMVIEVPE